MCGIAGWIDFEQDLRNQRTTVEAMTDTMSCRGPDDSGTWFRPHAALGHRRLAIIDVPGGRQPMSVAGVGGQADQVSTHTDGNDPRSEVAMVYSGEAYNFGELRDELRRRGHRFDTDSDTEVVLHGYLDLQVAERLNGMYAFAVWDAREEALHLVRDRMGIKPLYYAPTKAGVMFGSEPKAILANPSFARNVGPDGLRELFAYVKTPGQAVWDGMREVEPGTTVTFDRSGSRVRRYWTLPVHEHTDSTEVTVSHVRELLDDIVARQLVADVPRCLLLSGGLDSSVLTALAARQLSPVGEQVRSFAVDFAGQTENFVGDELRGTPDAPYVADVAAHSGTSHQDIMLDSAALTDPSVRRDTVIARDLPAGLGDMDLSLLLLFRAIRQHSTVALSGESADEVFGGYRWFHVPEVQQADTFPWHAFLGAQREGADSGSVMNGELFGRLDLRSYIADSYRDAVAEIPDTPWETPQEKTMRRLCHLHLTRFVRILLDRKDRMSMATGLEVRVPFCDHRLVEYVYNTPWGMKTFDGREKSLLRAATRDVLPTSVAERVKSPYPSTQDHGYVVALQQQARRLSGDDPAREFFDGEWLTSVLSKESGALGSSDRSGLERLLDLSNWTATYQPSLRVD